VSEETVNLDAVRKFHNPYQGFAGSSMPIPVDIRKVACELQGQTLPIRKAMERLRSATNGELRIVVLKDVNFVLLQIKAHGITYAFRVICFQ